MIDSPLHQRALEIWLEDNVHVDPGTPIVRFPPEDSKESYLEYEFPEVPVTVRVYENLTVEEVEEP